MSTVVLIRVNPRDAAGIAGPRRFAGGGTRGYTWLNQNDWRAGIIDEPRFTAQLGFDEGGWTKGGVSQAADIVVMPAADVLAAVAGLMWLDAPIVVHVGEESQNSFPARLIGTVAQVAIANGAITITAADLSVKLAKPVAPDTFAGTGGLEGGDDAAGRVKRRSFGRVFNVEGLVLDPAANVYEFGDPGRPLAGIVAVRDKGRSGPLAIIGWQGTAQLTLDVLAAATPPDGGATIAPSIACAKWWTQPSGPLTADLEGEIGAGYAETAADVAAAIVGGTGVAITDVAAAAAVRPAPAGLHIGNTTETAADALDRLLGGVSLLWVLSATGTIDIREWTWSAPVETLASSRVARTSLFRPVGSRTLGFQRNERIQGDGEIASDLDDIASDAASDAAAALARIAVIDSDGWLSAGEKPDVIRIVTTFTNEAPVLAAQAGRVGITSELATLQAAKSALDTYLGGLSPAWNDTTQDTAIVAATFQGRFTDYEYARALLVRAIAAKVSDNVDGVSDVANAAAADAAAALGRISVIDSDGWLSAGEKPDIIRLVTTFTDEAPVLAAQAGRAGITSELATLQAAKAALDAYLGGLSPAWNDTTQDTAIVAATFQGRFTDYGFSRVLLLKAIADAVAAGTVSLNTNVAIIPGRTSATSGIVGTSTGSAPSANNTVLSWVVEMDAPGYIEAQAYGQHGYTAAAAYGSHIYVDGVQIPEATTGGAAGAVQNSFFLQGAHYVSAAGSYTVTMSWDGNAGVTLNQRSLFVKGFPYTE